MASFNLVGYLLGKVSKDPWKMMQPVLKSRHPETVRKLQIWMLKEGVFEVAREKSISSLKTTVFDRKFPNPIGLAAGYDPHCEIVDELITLGFGFGEVGSITADPDVVPRRVIRLAEDEGLIEQTAGFTSPGVKEMSAILTARRGRRGIVGTSIGEGISIEGNEDDGFSEREAPALQYERALRAVAPYSDFVTINLSNPNMAGIGEFQIEDGLMKLLEKLRKTIDAAAPINTPPLLLKMASDMNDMTKEVTAKCVLANNIDGLIVAGPTRTRPESLQSPAKENGGGLAGKPLFAHNHFLVKEMYYFTQGKIPIIAVGGISSGEDAYKMIRAGASLVQVYSALIYQGPLVINSIKKELAACLKKDGFKTVSEAVGADMY